MANFHGYLRTVFERAELTKSAAIQAQIQHFESAYHNIYSIYELLLERAEEPVLQNQISLLNRADPR